MSGLRAAGLGSVKGVILGREKGVALGCDLTVDGVLEPMELRHLPKGRTFEDFVGAAGLKRHGKEWKRSVDDVVKCLIGALEAEYVVLGGGNADKVGKPPHKARLGNNGNAFEGGFQILAGSFHQVCPRTRRGSL